MITGDGWRRIGLSVLRSLRVLAWLITWPPWKLTRAWMRRDPELATMVHDRDAAWYTRKYGPYHTTTLVAQADHAVALCELGELQQAEAELTEVIIRLNPLEDGNASLLLFARLWHYHIVARLGWVSQTEADARFMASTYGRQLGPDHPDTLHWRELTAVALWEADQHDAARAEMAYVAARRAATQGATHPDTLSVERTLSFMTNNENGSFDLESSAE